MKVVVLGIALAVGLQLPLAAQTSEKEMVVAAVKAVSTAIEEGEDVSGLAVTPPIDKETIAGLLGLSGCRGSASRDSTLAIVKILYVCGSPNTRRSGPIMPKAALVEMQFENGVMTKISTTAVNAVPLEGDR